jgi:hypothetical protein
MNYRPNSFIVQELVPPDVYKMMGERSWEVLNPMALMTLQAVRDAFGPITVNNWHAGGQYKESGFRAPWSKTGAKLSQHRFGGAFDCKSSKVTPREMHDYILVNRPKFPYLTVIENTDATPTWLHIDCRNHNRSGIWIVNP